MCSYTYSIFANAYSRRLASTVAFIDLQTPGKAGEWQSRDLAEAEAIWGTPHAYGWLRTAQQGAF
jgi:hypothetical protein